MGRRRRHGRPHARADEGVRPIISPFDARRSADRTILDRGAVARPGATLEARIDAALERVRPAIRRDGGDVWLVKVEGDVAYVQMIGACGGCPASNATLKGGIEAVVREDVPEIHTVEQV
jgi:Fe-S cluster biogenesis protein NfuA